MPVVVLMYFSRYNIQHTTVLFRELYYKVKQVFCAFVCILCIICVKSIINLLHCSTIYPIVLVGYRA